MICRALCSRTVEKELHGRPRPEIEFRGRRQPADLQDGLQVDVSAQHREEPSGGGFAVGEFDMPVADCSL